MIVFSNGPIPLKVNDPLKTVPPFPPVDNFLNIHLTKNILTIKDVEFDFRTGVYLSNFLFLRIIKMQI